MGGKDAGISPAGRLDSFRAVEGCRTWEGLYACIHLSEGNSELVGTFLSAVRGILQIIHPTQCYHHHWFIAQVGSRERGVMRS
jgi:hypothetical protein